ncbi:hypothetical protein RB595_009100 [Gaeumannomyces hyphopodioides]
MSSFLARRAAAAPRAAARAFGTTSPRSLARIQLIGNLADAPELHAASSGREMVRYAIAVNSGPKDNRKTSWFRVASFEAEGPRRDFVLALPKGAMVYIDGDVSMQTYEDTEGKLRSALNITQRNLEVLKRPQAHEQQQPPQQE